MNSHINKPITKYLTLVSIDAPTVDLDLLKAHLGIIFDNDDDRLTAYTLAAIKDIENSTGNSYLEKSYILTLSGFPTLNHWMNANLAYWGDMYPWYSRTGDRNIYLPQPPLKSDTVIVQYYDLDNVLQTWSTDEYYVQYPSFDPGWITPVDDYPATYDRPDSVQITYSTGVTGMPDDLELAVLNMVSMFNENREGQWDFKGLDRFIANNKQARY